MTTFFKMVVCQWKYCNKEEYDSKSLYEHIQKAHIGYKRQGTLTTLCLWTDCTFTSERRDRMRSHVLCHIDSKLYQCDMCIKSYKWKHDLLSHERKTHGKEVKMVTPIQRRKSQNLQVAHTIMERRNTLSDLHFESLAIANENMKQQCNPETFCIDASTTSASDSHSNENVLDVPAMPSRRHSVHSLGSDLNSSAFQRRLSSQDVFYPAQMITIPTPPIAYDYQQLSPYMANRNGQLATPIHSQKNSLDGNCSVPIFINASPTFVQNFRSPQMSGLSPNDMVTAPISPLSPINGNYCQIYPPNYSQTGSPASPHFQQTFQSPTDPTYLQSQM